MWVCGFVHNNQQSDLTRWCAFSPVAIIMVKYFQCHLIHGTESQKATFPPRALAAPKVSLRKQSSYICASHQSHQFSWSMCNSAAVTVFRAAMPICDISF